MKSAPPSASGTTGRAWTMAPGTVAGALKLPPAGRIEYLTTPGPGSSQATMASPRGFTSTRLPSVRLASERSCGGPNSPAEGLTDVYTSCGEPPYGPACDQAAIAPP